MPDIASGYAEHRDCEWEKVGHCVYCKDHGTRLYVGDLPDDSKAMADALAAIREAAVRMLVIDGKSSNEEGGSVGP